ncbi:MAG: diacylglycerol kinase family protein [Erysipelotrichaceae bacterium]|nr:diacylglycerol kinase family protein [Erysipelotrichaceae bacterium]
MKKFKDAFRGIKDALKEKAVRTQFILGLMAILGGIIIRLDYYEWLIFIICIALVISLEIVNSCLERICDMYSTEIDERIRIIKDYASGAVLISAIASFVICILVVLRRLI